MIRKMLLVISKKLFVSCEHAMHLNSAQLMLPKCKIDIIYLFEAKALFIIT